VQQTRAFFMQFRGFGLDEFAQKAHQTADLFFGAAPVLGREGIEGQVLDAGIGSRADDTSQVLRAGSVPGQARQTALFRPATIPIHDDADMHRHASTCFGH